MLLSRLGLPFSAEAPGVDESGPEDEAPATRARRLARDKARAVAARHPEAIVIGSDQVASVAEGDVVRVLHKPGNRETCRAQLAAMSGHTARFDTAVVIIRGHTELAHADLTEVRFRTLTPAQIDHYIDREPSFDCAGGFKCEGLGVTLFESIVSRDPTALVGLPLIWVCEALRQLDVQV